MLHSTCTYTHTHTHTLPTLTGHAKNTTLVLDRRASVREPNSQALEGFLRHFCKYIPSHTQSPTVIAPRTSYTSSHTDTSRMQTQFKSYPPDGRASTPYSTAASHILTECCVYSVVGERVGGEGEAGGENGAESHGVGIRAGVLKAYSVIILSWKR